MYFMFVRFDAFRRMIVFFARIVSFVSAYLPAPLEDNSFGFEAD